MVHDWLLVETLGDEPVVVAQGRHTVNLVPISGLLRRSPHLMAIQTAIGETVRARQGLSSITPKNDRVIRTEVVAMTDGPIHGVHLWIGPPDMEPTERPAPGALLWDLDHGVATGTPESLLNSGWAPDSEVAPYRTFADDLPRRDLNPSEATVLGMAITREPGRAFSSTWNVVDHNGEPVTVGFVIRVVREAQDDGSHRLLCRAMNWRSEPDPATAPPDHLAQRILEGLAQPGVHRALVDLSSWTLLKWLDEPPAFFDWRTSMAGDRVIHPDDRGELVRMATAFESGTASVVLRMSAADGWAPVHVTVNRVEIGDGVFAGLATLRRATGDDLTDPR
ncbi:DUF5593 domain-containing protein [Mycolicibacterium flavescens]|uniref:Rv3651-like N-terminal domain-containing protein n=1 Tax=Mycolicibacterium flavescens TaxID=1776 RepID=A0A1E3REQ9_MYCFV|nr:PAS domain-containing protein [Mycolicibacterium flavescens]MCV7280843.1 DUF5593 domain-containing protein [Mycolicibacterium flavescens]ODQ88343.1 hypothetical protein BHQ18_19570 [Mycolicibacterium flavescens]